MNFFKEIFNKIFKKKKEFENSIIPISEPEEYNEIEKEEEEIEQISGGSNFNKLIQDLEFNKEEIIKRQNEERKIAQIKIEEEIIRKELGDVGELKEKQSYTERLLLKAMNKIGLFPEEQYQIDLMSVDFAFPINKVVIEVDGPYHQEEEQKLADIRRGYILRDNGWSVWRLDAEKVFNNPIKMAYRIKSILERRRLNLD
jgi:very-short-patch-repair endonuclease